MITDGDLAIKFGRFLLKYGVHHFDKEGSLCWMYEGKEYNTDELFEIFLKEYN